MLGRYLDWLERASLGVCCLLALLATVVWYGCYSAASHLNDALEAWPSSLAELPGWLVLWSSGSVYSVLVLFRYAGRRGGSLAVVALAGAFSYWAGVQLSLHLDAIDSLTARVALAGVGAAVFLAAVCMWLGSLRRSLPLIATIGAAGAVGGAVIGWSVDEDTGIGPFVLGHALWQLLTCVALFTVPLRRAAAA